jgi:formylglycine-generating enzyme required for sulfatase activity
MNDIPREKLLGLIKRFGIGIGADPRRCEFLLRDVCGEHKREIVVLVAAVKESIPNDLISSDERIPRQALLERLARKLHDDHGIILDLARWAVETWAIGLKQETHAHGASSWEYKMQIAVQKPNELLITNSIGIRLKQLPVGELVFGEQENPQSIAITKPFYLGIYQVTQQEFKRIMGRNPSHFKNFKRPVECVTMEQAIKFCQVLTSSPEEKANGRRYRLPTEVEWEYACRAGSTTEFSFGNDEHPLTEYAWFAGNAKGETHPVGQKKPNSWGLYDMHGNISEWCESSLNAPLEDLASDANGCLKVVRGGSWLNEAKNCRSAARERILPSMRYDHVGFRIAMTTA